IANMLEVGREIDDIEGLAAFLLGHRLPVDPRDVELDGFVELVHAVVEGAYRRDTLGIVEAKYLDHLVQHRFHDISDPQRLSSGAGKRHGRSVEQVLIKMPG